MLLKNLSPPPPSERCHVNKTEKLSYFHNYKDYPDRNFSGAWGRRLIPQGSSASGDAGWNPEGTRGRGMIQPHRQKCQL